MKRQYNISKEKLETYLIDHSLKSIAELEGVSVWTIMERVKEYGLKPLGASYFNKGINNPAKKLEVREKISKTVKGLWNNGVYADRINGMSFKFDWEHPNYKPSNSYRTYAMMYHNPLTCYYCGCSESERKIDIHHLDEDRNNWLLSNLLPVCNVCHTFFHFKRYKGPFVTVGKYFRFESAHHLMNYCGPCEHTHGHSYTLLVTLRGPVNRDTGMVIDYKQLKTIVQTHIIDVFDHVNINDTMDCNPTAENMLFFIWEKLEKDGLVKGLYEISINETDTSVATINKSDMLEYYTRNKELICFEDNGHLKLPSDMKKVRCEICGKEFFSLSVHLKYKHSMAANEYKQTYNLPIEDQMFTEWKRNCMMRKVGSSR